MSQKRLTKQERKAIKQNRQNRRNRRDFDYE